MADPSIGRASPGTRRRRPQLLVVGAAARDLNPADPRGWRIGGTVSYAALTAARLGVAVRALIGADDEAASAHELDTLRDAGVELMLVPLDRGPIFENQHVEGVRRQLVHQLSASLDVGALPEAWQTPDAVLLGPVAGELGEEWADFAPDALIGLAWQGLLRDLVAGQRVGHLPLSTRPLVHRADVLFVSAEDVAAGGPPLDELLRDGQELFVTHGHLGALHISHSGDRRSAWFVPPRPRRIAVDTTGAGDVFLAAYMAARLLAPELAGTRAKWRLSAIAAAAASLNVAAPTLAGVPGVRDLCTALITPRA